jgi:multicomponent Na+:H+ antiporter subunit C
MAWYLIGVVFLIGLWGVIAADNLIRKIIGLSIANSGVIMLFVYFGAESGDTAPILLDINGTPVDPIPQALMLTAIVVGICVVAMALVLVYRLYRRFGTLDAGELEQVIWKGRDE